MISDAERIRAETVFDVVVSMPHSGTRTLVKTLGFPNPPGTSGSWWHFGTHDALMRHWRIKAHIPIRHPLMVAQSWASRQKTGDVLRSMLSRYAKMFEYIDNKHNGYLFYRIEDYPVLAGSGEYSTRPNKSVLITKFKSAVEEQVIAPHRDFFKRFYEDI